MASARFLTSADASHPAAAISRSCACESSARRSAIRETGSISARACQTDCHKVLRQLGASLKRPSPTASGSRPKQSSRRNPNTSLQVGAVLRYVLFLPTNLHCPDKPRIR
eukprot:scaffold21994_cov71-Phaeocystis_antarctica.AAC.1